MNHFSLNNIHGSISHCLATILKCNKRTDDKQHSANTGSCLGNNEVVVTRHTVTHMHSSNLYEMSEIPSRSTNLIINYKTV